MKIYTIQEKMMAMQRSEVFSRLPAQELRVVADMSEVVRLDADELLFDSGDDAETVYVLAQGELAVYYPGREKPVSILEPGEVVGEYGHLLRQGRTASVRAVTDAVLLSLDAVRFEAFLLKFPKATLELLRTTIKRLVVLREKVRTG